MDAPSYNDIYQKQQATDLCIARLDGKVDNIIQLLQIRNEQVAELKATTERLVKELKEESAARTEALWNKLRDTDAQITNTRADHAIALREQANSSNREIKVIEGKLLMFSGGLAVVVLFLTIFAPVIQEQILPHRQQGETKAHQGPPS